MTIAKADVLLEAAVKNLGLTLAAPPSALYLAQDRIRLELERMHTINPIAVGTTGTITERICEWGLRISIPNGFSRLGQNEKWMGDFSILGYPLNALVSVKSFKAKERLMASGLGMSLVPTIAFGWFDDPREFGVARCKSYRDKAFAAIYMPEDTLSKLSADSRAFLNTNQRPLLRGVQSMPNDLKAALKTISYGEHCLDAVCTSKL